MDWECPECDRRYDDPPERCVCGGQVVPAGTTDRDRDVLTRAVENLYNVFFDPSAVSHGLLEAGPRVRLAFRVIVVLSVLLILTVVVGSFL